MSLKFVVDNKINACAFKLEAMLVIGESHALNSCHSDSTTGTIFPA
jgi:hypothetical protein